MAIRGIFASHSALVGERVGDLASRVLMYGPVGSAPLLALSSGMPTSPARDTVFQWWEDSHIAGRTKITTGIDDAVTAVVVDSTELFVPKTVLMNESTGEYVFVTAITGNSLTIIRGWAGTTAAAMLDSHYFQSVGTAHEQAATRPEPIVQKGESRLNYTQIFWNGWAISGTANAIQYVTGSQLANNRQMCMTYHAEDIERAFLYSRKTVTVHNGKQLTMTDGVIPQIRQYGGLVESAEFAGEAGYMALDGDGSLSNFMRRIFDKNIKGMPNERIAFTGSATLELVNRMARKDASYNITVGETSYGLKVTEIIGFNGSLKLMTHPLMTENPTWAKMLLVLHPGGISKRILRNTETHEYGTGGRAVLDGKDAIEGDLRIELGFEAKGVQTMGILEGITTAVSSDFEPEEG
jgi:hypothetical protein